LSISTSVPKTFAELHKNTASARKEISERSMSMGKPATVIDRDDKYSKQKLTFNREKVL
jgi:hypothetical protein